MDWNNKKEVLNIVKNNGLLLNNASAELRDDPDVVLKAIKNNNNAFQYASDRLRDDADFVKEAVTNSGWAMKFASERLRDNYDFISEIIKDDPYVLQEASERICDNADIITEAVNIDGWVIQYASERLRNNENIMLIAMKNLKDSCLDQDDMCFLNSLTSCDVYAIEKELNNDLQFGNVDKIDDISDINKGETDTGVLNNKEENRLFGEER